MLRFEQVSAKAGRKLLTQDICFSVLPGTVTALLGKNGSGKTSLLRCIHGLCPYEGKIRLDGKDLQEFSPRSLARWISILSQRLPAPTLTVEQLVSMGRIPYQGLNSSLDDNDREAVNEALGDTDLATLRHRRVCTLSGGERQRAFLAMCLCQDTPYLLLDEPTAALDHRQQRRSLELFSRLVKEQNKAILLIHHDPGQALAIADRVVMLEMGRQVFEGSAKECLEQKVIEESYGCRRYQVQENEKTHYFFV